MTLNLWLCTLPTRTHPKIPENQLGITAVFFICSAVFMVLFEDYRQWGVTLAPFWVNFRDFSLFLATLGGLGAWF